MVQDLTILEFTDRLSSGEPVPGGGGASALAGAMAASLGAMVACLTIGKKKYAAVEADIKEDLKDLTEIRKTFLRLADKDEEAFLPLSRAYGMPKNTEEEKKVRDIYMEQVLYDACLVPLSVMETASAAAEILYDLSLKGSSLAISDAGAAAACLRACLDSAAYNVRINVKSMKNGGRAGMLSEKAEKLSLRTQCLIEQTEKTVKDRI